MLLDKIYAGDVIFACARVSFLSLPSVSTLRLDLAASFLSLPSVSTLRLDLAAS